MSNRIFQSLVHQMRDAVGRTLGVIDETGTIIACSELSKIGEVISTASDVFADGELHYINNCTFCNFGTHIQTEYAVFVEGTDELAHRNGRYRGGRREPPRKPCRDRFLRPRPCGVRRPRYLRRRQRQGQIRRDGRKVSAYDRKIPRPCQYCCFRFRQYSASALSWFQRYFFL